ncbi:MAG: N-acetylglucosamine-6-phosphate deacetylase [Lentisphaeria bacterium]|nr:N-acetylglucosamine-6-phosphate deacetylase [Lentisphaeria bacterium]
MAKLIKNVRIVSPGRDIPRGHLVMEGEKISKVSPGDPAAENGFDTVIDGAGNYVVPGFVDIHCHGHSDLDFCDRSTQAFSVIGRKKLEEGVTRFLPTSLSVSMEDLRFFCEQAEEYRKKDTQGAILAGVHLEGPFINPARAGAQNPDFLKMPDIAVVDALDAISKVVKVTYSPELPGGVELARALTERGIMPSGGHTEASYECFEACRKAGMKHLAHFCNAMIQLHHLPGQFGIMGGGLLRDDVYLELICDGVHLSDEMIRLVAKVKGPEKIMLITDSMRAAGMPDGNYSLGGLPVVVKNGRATIPSGKVAGSTLRYYNGLKKLVRVTEWPLCEAIRCTGLNQAESLNWKDVGKLEEGFLADITVLNKELEPETVICSGQVRWRKNQEK